MATWRKSVRGGGAPLARLGRLVLWPTLALLPAAGGAAVVLVLKPAGDPLLWWYLVAMAGAAGAYGAVLALRAGSAAARAATLEAECRDLAQKCSTYLARARAAEDRVEGLALIREIHRTGNVATRAERVRALLSAVAETAEASQAELFTPEGSAAAPALAAVFRRLADGEFYAHFDRPLSAGEADVKELAFRKLDQNTSGARSVLRLEISAGHEPVGFADLALLRSSTRQVAGNGAREALESMVRSLDLDPSGADQALEHRQISRVHDQARKVLSISYPLMAEGSITGAIRLAVPDEVLAHKDLAEVEEVLKETAGHIGLVVKKDEDVERARRDGLTGLLLKAELFRDLREALGAAAANGGRLALLMIDIDHFKKVNDTWGHLTGDAVLKGVAGCVASGVRYCDRAYRYGGEEMAVLLPGADGAAAARTAERLRKSAAALEFAAEDGSPVGVTISVGLADAAGKLADPEELIGRADQALYLSKERGRDRCSAWRPEGPAELPRATNARSARR